MICVTQQGIDQENARAVKACAPPLAEGHAADSPGNAGPLTQVRLPWQVDVQGDGPVASAVRFRQPGLQAVDPDSAGVALTSAGGSR